MNIHLNLLSSDDIFLTMAFTEEPKNIRVLLRHDKGIKAFINVWKEGLIQPEEVNDFLIKIFKALEHGVIFEHEDILCALAVAFESCDGDYPLLILQQIADFKVEEAPTAFRVAQCCLEHRNLKSNPS